MGLHTGHLARCWEEMIVVADASCAQVRNAYLQLELIEYLPLAEVFSDSRIEGSDMFVNYSGLFYLLFLWMTRRIYSLLQSSRRVVFMVYSSDFRKDDYVW